MSKHTKGPWEYFIWNKSKPNIKTIGAQHLEDGEGDHIFSAELSDADARLIAAAPEMLAALKAVRDRDTDDPNGYDKVFDLVLNAISKAERGSL